MSLFVPPDVQALVQQLTPLAEQVANDKRDFIIADLALGPVISTGLEIGWPMVIQSVPTMLKVSIDLILSELAVMPSGQLMTLLANHRTYKEMK